MESKMWYSFHLDEKRRYPRISITLPFEYRNPGNSSPQAGLVSNLSETGKLIYSVTDIPIGSEFKTEVFFPNGFEFDGFRVIAKAVWKDIHFETDWYGYKCGLQFLQMLEEDRWKLLNLLVSPQLFGEVFSRKKF
jgi:c-di-GMP-binding flagellar brake protein YcgR